MKSNPMKSTYRVSFLLLVVPSLILCSCSTLVGNVKPVDEKSQHYRIMDLSREYPEAWRKLDEKKIQSDDAKIGDSDKAFSSELTDLVFQSKKNAAIISLNSSCREGRGEIEQLDPYLRELLLGVTEVTEKSLRDRQVNGVSAREGVIAGKMAGQNTKIHAVVLSNGNCVYDLMYVSRPDRYSIHEEDFNRFVSSLRLR